MGGKDYYTRTSRVVPREIFTNNLYLPDLLTLLHKLEPAKACLSTWYVAQLSL